VKVHQNKYELNGETIYTHDCHGINSSTISMLNQLNQFNAQFAQKIVVELYKAHIKCYYIINYFRY